MSEAMRHHACIRTISGAGAECPGPQGQERVR